MSFGKGVLIFAIVLLLVIGASFFFHSVYSQTLSLNLTPVSTFVSSNVEVKPVDSLGNDFSVERVGTDAKVVAGDYSIVISPENLTLHPVDYPGSLQCGDFEISLSKSTNKKVIGVGDFSFSLDSLHPELYNSTSIYRIVDRVGVREVWSKIRVNEVFVNVTDYEELVKVNNVSSVRVVIGSHLQTYNRTLSDNKTLEYLVYENYTYKFKDEVRSLDLVNGDRVYLGVCADSKDKKVVKDVFDLRVSIEGDGLLLSAPSFITSSQTDWNNGSVYVNTTANSSGQLILGFGNRSQVAKSGFSSSVNVTGLVGSWHFDNDSSFGENQTNAYDFAEDNLNATLQNGVIINSTGKVKGALRFDGVNDLANVTSTIFNNTGDKTIAVWIYMNTLNQDGWSVIDRSQAGTNTGWGVYIVTTGVISYIKNGVAEVRTTATISTGTWNHLVIAKNASGVNFYINGGAIATTTNNNAEIGGVSMQTFIGRRPRDPTIIANGSIDEIMLFNRTLTSAEASNIYEIQKNNYPDNGEYFSQVFDGGSVQSWNNVNSSFNSSSGANESIGVQVRSCDDSLCSGETFVGPTNTSSSTYVFNITLNSTVTPTNRYFQYKVFLNTTDRAFSPYVLSVNISSANTEAISIYNVTAPGSSSQVCLGQVNVSANVNSSNGSVGVSFGGTNYSMSNVTVNFFNRTIINLVNNTYSYYVWGYSNATVPVYNQSGTSSYLILNNTNTLTATNNTALGFVLSVTPSSHYLALSNTTAIQGGNVTASFSGFTVGAVNVSVNGLFVGTINTTDTSPKVFLNVGLSLSSVTNVTYTPLLATTTTLIQTNVTYEFGIPCGIQDTIVPNFYNSSVSPSNNSVYNGTQQINFTININNTNNTAFIQLDSVNYSMNNASGYFNRSFYNLLSAGNHAYYFGAWNNSNSSGALYNKTSIQNYFLQKGYPLLNVTCTSPVTYGVTTDCSILDNNLGDGDLTYSISPGNGVFGVGTQSFNGSTSGGNNYSANSTNTVVTIVKGSLTGSITSSLGFSYEYTSGSDRINLSESNPGDGDVIYKLFLDGVDISNGTLITLGAGSYTVKLNSTGGANYSANTSIDLRTITVTSNITRALLVELLDDRTLNITYAYNPLRGINVSFNGTNYTQVYFSINETGMVLFQNINLSLGVGTWTVFMNESGNQNYTQRLYYIYATITQQGNNITCLQNGIANDTTVTFPQKINITGVADQGAVIITRNGSVINSGQSYVVGGGVWTNNCSVANSQNYTQNSTLLLSFVNRATGEVRALLGGIRDNRTLANNTLSINFSADNLSVGSTSGLITLSFNGSIINNGRGIISNITNLSLLPFGTYNLTANSAQDQNYTSDVEWWYFTYQLFIPGVTTTTSKPACRWRKFLYYNKAINILREKNCI